MSLFRLMASQSSSLISPLVTVMDFRSMRLPIRVASWPGWRLPIVSSVPQKTVMRPMVVLPFLLSSITRISPVAAPLVMSAGAVTVRMRLTLMEAFHPSGTVIR